VPTALAIVALLVFSGLIKPALKAATATPVGRQLDAVVADPLAPPEPSATLALASPQSEKHLADARALARQNPAAVAHIVRDWVSREA
jgi:flagellar M-ring protein FliF